MKSSSNVVRRSRRALLVSAFLFVACRPEGSSPGYLEPTPDGATERRDAMPSATGRDGPKEGGRADGSVPVASQDVAAAVEAPPDAASVAVDAGMTAADTAPKGFTLPNLPGLVLLLDATKGVTTQGTKVSRWVDQSGKGNDAKNGNAGFQPELAKDEKGLAMVRFSGKRPAGKGNTDGHGGTFLRVLDNASIQFGTGDWLIELVVAYRNELDGSHNGGFGTFFGKYGNSGEILFTGNWTTSNHTVEQACVHIGFGEASPIGFETKRGSLKDPTHPLNDGKIRVIGVRKFGNQLEVRINGASEVVPKTISAGTNLSMAGAHIGIGSFSATSDTDSQRALDGDIYFMVVHKGGLADDELAALEDALIARFNPAP